MTLGTTRVLGMVPQLQVELDQSSDRPQVPLEAEPPRGLPRVTRLGRGKRRAPAELRTGQRMSWGHVTTAGPHLGCARNDARPSRARSKLLGVRRTGTTRGPQHGHRTRPESHLPRGYDHVVTRDGSLGRTATLFRNPPWGPPRTLRGDTEPLPPPPGVLGGMGTHTTGYIKDAG